MRGRIDQSRGRELAQLFYWWRLLQWPMPADDRDVVHGRAVEDFEHGVGDIVFSSAAGGLSSMRMTSYAKFSDR